MDARDLVLSVVASCPGSRVPGRTILQKIVYFCSVRLKLAVDYHPHYYGPYSEEVAQAVRSLSALGFLSEARHKTSAGAWGYEYHVTKDGREVLSTLDSAVFRRIHDLVSEITSVKGWDHSPTISCAAKVYLILHKNRRPMTQEAISEEAENLGWKLDTETIGGVVSFLTSLGLVTAR